MTRLYTGAFLRALATGMAGVLLGLYVARLGLSATWLGLILSAGLGGATLSVAVATWWGDRIGRRRALLWLTTLSAVGGVMLALGSEGWLIVAAALLGMLNGMGRDRGAALVLEQAILPATTNDAGRTTACCGFRCCSPSTASPVAFSARHWCRGISSRVSALRQR